MEIQDKKHLNVLPEDRQWIQTAGSAGLQTFYHPWSCYTWCLFSSLNKCNFCDKSMVRSKKVALVDKTENGWFWRNKDAGIWSAPRTNQSWQQVEEPGNPVRIKVLTSLQWQVASERVQPLHQKEVTEKKQLMCHQSHSSILSGKWGERELQQWF